MTDLPPVVQRALEAECGNPIVEENAVDPASRSALERVATEPDWPPPLRRRAVYLLGLWPDDGTVETIGRAIEHLDELGRMAAGTVLAGIQTSAALSLLDRLVSDEADDVRRVAINAIGESRLPKAEALLRHASVNDRSGLNRERASILLPP